MKLRIFAALVLINTLLAEEYYPRKSLEIGYERYTPTSQRPDTAGTGLLLNYYPSRAFHIGTNQNIVSTGPGYTRSDFAYRPDVHIGVTLPLLEQLFAEFTMGIDLVTTGILALAVVCNTSCAQNNTSYSRSSAKYDGYLNFGTALRWHWDALALKLIAQMQYGGYPVAIRDSLGYSAWLGAGATYRFKL
jgi:hypothetical protein